MRSMRRIMWVPSCRGRTPAARRARAVLAMRPPRAPDCPRMDVDALLDWYDARARARCRGARRGTRTRCSSRRSCSSRRRPRAWCRTTSASSPRFPDARRAGGRPARPRCSRSGAAWATTAARSPLQRAAAQVAEHGWPGRPARSCPGVGPYTAAAVASFAFGATSRRIDTNVRRVLGATTASAAPARAAARRRALGRAAPFNQAMMELGATVCTARRPRCGALPRRAHVRAGRARTRAPRGGPARALRGHGPLPAGRVVAALLAGEPLPELEAGRMPGARRARARRAGGRDRSGGPSACPRVG